MAQPAGRATTILASFKGKSSSAAPPTTDQKKESIKARGIIKPAAAPSDRFTIASATAAAPQPPTRVDALSGTATRFGVRKSEQIERALAAMTSLTEQTYAEAQMAENLRPLLQPPTTQTRPIESTEIAKHITRSENGKSVLTVVTETVNNQFNVRQNEVIHQKILPDEPVIVSSSVPAEYRELLLKELSAHKAALEREFRVREERRMTELDAVRAELEEMAVKVYNSTLTIAKQSKELEDRERAVGGHRMKITAEYERHMADQAHKHKIIVDGIGFDKEQLNACLREKEIALQQAVQRLAVIEKEYDSLQAHVGRFQKKDDQHSIAVDAAKDELRAAQQTIKDLQTQYTDSKCELLKAIKEKEESDNACQYYLNQLRECIGRYQNLEKRVAEAEAARFEKERAELEEKTRKFEADKQVALALGGHAGSDSMRPSTVLADQLLANLHATGHLKSQAAAMLGQWTVTDQKGEDRPQAPTMSAVDVAFATGDDVALLKEMVKGIQADITSKAELAQEKDRERRKQREKDKATIVYAAGHAHPLVGYPQRAAAVVGGSQKPKSAGRYNKSDMATCGNAGDDGHPLSHHNHFSDENASYESRSGTVTNGSFPSDEDADSQHRRFPKAGYNRQHKTNKVHSTRSHSQTSHHHNPNPHQPTSPVQQLLDISISTMSSYNDTVGPSATVVRGSSMLPINGGGPLTNTNSSESSSGGDRAHASSGTLRPHSRSRGNMADTPIQSYSPTETGPVQQRAISKVQRPANVATAHVIDSLLSGAGLLHSGGSPLADPRKASAKSLNASSPKTNPRLDRSELVVSGVGLSTKSQHSSRPSSVGSSASSARGTVSSRREIEPMRQMQRARGDSSPIDVSPNTTVAISPMSSTAGTPGSTVRRQRLDQSTPTSAVRSASGSKVRPSSSSGTSPGMQLQPFPRTGPMGPFTFVPSKVGSEPSAPATTSVATDSVASFLESVKASKAQILATGGYTEDDDLIKQMTQKIETYTRFLESGRFQ